MVEEAEKHALVEKQFFDSFAEFACPFARQEM